mgnify:CR=1 FL=1
MRITDIRTHRNTITITFDSGARLDMHFDGDDADSFAQCIEASSVDLCVFHPAQGNIVCNNTLNMPKPTLREQPWHGGMRWLDYID